MSNMDQFLTDLHTMKDQLIRVKGAATSAASLKHQRHGRHSSENRCSADATSPELAGGCLAPLSLRQETVVQGVVVQDFDGVEGGEMTLL